MGLVGAIMVRHMKKEAVRIAKKVYQHYPPERYNNETDHSLGDLFVPFFGKHLTEYSKELQDHVSEKIITIEGFCYMAALDLGALRGSMVLRCLQFTVIMDEELYKRGYKKQAIYAKDGLLRAFEIAVGDYRPYLYS